LILAYPRFPPASVVCAAPSGKTCAIPGQGEDDNSGMCFQCNTWRMCKNKESKTWISHPFRCQIRVEKIKFVKILRTCQFHNSQIEWF